VTADGNRLLVVGVYLTDYPNRALETVRELERSVDWNVEQRWIALGQTPMPSDLRRVTVAQVHAPTDKFRLINRLLPPVVPAAFDHLLVCDDDVDLPPVFLDRYLSLVQRYDFALAQPARTHESSIDHPIVEQLDGLDARQTRFVEIGPCLSMRADAATLLTPFDERPPMGWGADFVWPCLLEAQGLKLGIVDATPVAHCLRKTVSLYSRDGVDERMAAYLRERSHLSRAEAFVILRAHASR
jgi:hypothetical protein